MKKAQDYFRKGYDLDSQGKFNEAIKCYDKAIEIDPEFYEAYRLKAAAYRNFGQEGGELAVQCCDRAIEIDPDNPIAYSDKGWYLENLCKNYEEAIIWYDTAIELGPDVSNSYYNKGHVLKVLGRYKDAVPYFTKAHELAPNEPLYLCNRGDALNRVGKKDMASKDFAQAYSLIQTYKLKSHNVLYSKEEIKFIQNTVKAVENIHEALDDITNEMVQQSSNSKARNEISQIKDLLNTKVVNLAMQGVSQKLKTNESKAPTEQDIIKKLVADNQDLKAKNEFFMEMITQLNSRLEALESTEQKVALVSDIVYDNELLNHFEILEPAVKTFGISQVLDMSRNLSPALISEAVEQNNGELLLAGCISLNHVDSF